MVGGEEIGHEERAADEPTDRGDHGQEDVELFLHLVVEDEDIVLEETVEKVAGQDEQLAGTAGEPTGPAVKAESFAEDHLPLPLRPS